MQQGEADKEVVRALMEHLVKAFEQFAEEMADKTPEGLRYIDALMGCHNFYKAILLDLERRSGNHGAFPRIAIDTLAQAFGKGKPGPFERIAYEEISKAFGKINRN